MVDVWLVVAIAFLLAIFAFMLAITQGWIDITKPQLVFGSVIFVKSGRRE